MPRQTRCQNGSFLRLPRGLQTERGGAAGFWPHSNSFLKRKQSGIKSQIVPSAGDWEDDSVPGTQVGPGLEPIGWGVRGCMCNIVVIPALQKGRQNSWGPRASDYSQISEPQIQLESLSQNIRWRTLRKLAGICL